MHPTDDSLSEPNMPATDAPVRKRRWTRWLIWLIVFSLVMLIAGELVARFYLGLGDPPLTMPDPVMGYRFKPSMTYHRFGHVIHYNAYSERSDDFPPRKSQPGELRVMVIGDSVINGGVLTDQSETSTAVLQRRLTDDLHLRVLVGNASAGGWGPPNELGYVQEFGFLDADVVVLVVSSHDASGFSWNVAGAPDFVGKPPVSALWEGFTRYAMPRLRGYFGHPDVVSTAKLIIPGEALSDQPRCLEATREIIERAQASGARVIVALHLENVELNGTVEPGHAAFVELLGKMGIQPVELGDAFRHAIQNGEQPYRDVIHPNTVGARVIADCLLPEIEKAVAAPTTSTTEPVGAH